VVCRAIDAPSMKIMSDSLRTMVFVKKGVFISKGSRCCSHHLYNGHLSYESLQPINGVYHDHLILNSDDIHNLIDDFRSVYKVSKIFDFDDASCLSDEAYFNITGLTKGTAVIYTVSVFFDI
jgi:hypothetical protein